MSHINHSLCQAGLSDTVASGLLTTQAILQLTQLACVEPATQQDGAGNHKGDAVPVATGPEGPGEQAAVKHQGSSLPEKQSGGLARSRDEGELGKSQEEGECRQSLERSQRFLRPLGKKELDEAVLLEDNFCRRWWSRWQQRSRRSRWQRRSRRSMWQR